MGRQAGMIRLAGKVAIITGAAGDIGAAALKSLVIEGARVVAIDLDGLGLERVLRDLSDEQACACIADVTRADDMSKAVNFAVERFGQLDIALLNAGIEGQVAPITDYEEEVFDRVIAVNVRGVWLGLKYSMQAMASSGGGSIVLTSSVAGVRGRKGISAYTASKHAVVGLMRTAAIEGAEFGVRVNTVNPGPVESRMIRALEISANPDNPDDVRQDNFSATPMGRYATPQEVANMMIFLASNESSHSTGSMFMVEGGRTA